MSTMTAQKRIAGGKIGKFLYKYIFAGLPDSFSHFLLGFFRNSSSSLGYGVRWAAYKKLCKRIGNDVIFEPSAYVINPENLVLGNDFVLHEFCYFQCSGALVSIGNNCAIAHGVSILTGKHNFEKYHKTSNLRCKGNTFAPIIIEDNVWVGCQSVILGGVIVGNGAVIGANSLVNKTIPSLTVNVGTPAKTIKKISPKYI